MSRSNRSSRVGVFGFAVLSPVLILAGCGPAGSGISGRNSAGPSNTAGGNPLIPIPAVGIGEVLKESHFPGLADAQKVLTSDKPVIVDFTATWCGPCQKLKPILHELEKEGLVNLVMVDTDEHPEIARTFGVSGIPHLLIVKDGKLAEQSVGFKTREQLDELLQAIQ